MPFYNIGNHGFQVNATIISRIYFTKQNSRKKGCLIKKLAQSGCWLISSRWIYIMMINVIDRKCFITNYCKDANGKNIFICGKPSTTEVHIGFP